MASCHTHAPFTTAILKKQRDYGKDAVASYISIVDLGGSVGLVGAAETAAPPTVSVRRLIGFRSPSNQIPFAAQSDCVRRPIRFRTPPDQIPYATRSDSVRRPIGLRSVSDDFRSTFGIGMLIFRCRIPILLLG